MWSLLLCFATGAWADEVTIDFSQKGYANGTAVASVEQDGITITFDKGTNKNNAPKYYTDGTAVRAYAGNTFTVSSSNTITKIELTFSGGGSNEITADAGTFESPTWTGSATSVMFTIGGTSGHRRIQKIVVTYNPPAGTPMAPTISGEDSFVGSTSVTITNNEDGATVYYTTNESDPTTSTTAQEYTAPFDISATTTVKAAAKKGDKWSSVASKTFTAIPSYANIGALTALGNNATFGFTGELLVVAKPTAKYAYVKDATGATLIYDDSETKLGNLEKGKTIAAPWTGKVSIYNKLFEAVPDAALTLNDGEAVPVTYDEASIADLTFDNVNKVVVLKGVTYTLGTGKNFTITKGDNNVAGYNQFNLTIEAAEDGKTYDIVGAISRYNDNIQFQPISITKTPELVSYEIKIVNTDGLTITPDVTTAKAGDKVYASYVLADHYQLEFPDFVDDDDQPIEFTEGVTAGLEEVGGEMKMWFIMPEKNVTIKAKATKLYQLSMTQPENGTITVISVNMGSDPYSKAGKPIRMMVTANEGYVIKSVEVKDANDAAVTVSAESGFEYGQAYNYVFTMPASDVKIGATIQKELEDININPETGADISQALATASEGKNVRNITINLNAGEYTMSAPIVAGGNVVINGAAGATIDASGITGSNKQFIVLNGTTEYVTKPDNTKDNAHLYIEKVDINNVTITGMPDGIIRDNQKTLLKNLTIDKCNIQVPNKVFVNFQSKGYVETLTVTNSTIWSADNAQFFVQYGSRLKNITGAETAGWLQTIDVKNSTFYHIAYGKNICDFPMNSQKCNVYTLKNNVFVDCGKSAGQVVIGFNKGSKSANPVWTVSDNLFNYNGNETSANEVAGAEQKEGADIVLQSVAGVVTFTDAAAGNFNGVVELPYGATEPTSLGDGRWTLSYTHAPVEHTYIVAGSNSDIFGTPWDPTNESNKMTNNGDGTYSKTYTVSEAVNEIQLKVVEDGTTWYGDAEGDNVVFNLSAAGSFTVNFDPATGIVTVTGDIVTGINTINADKAAENLENAEIYTLNGQRVEKPRKGLYIVNGKKVVIK